jgi:hypothetical protein
MDRQAAQVGPAGEAIAASTRYRMLLLPALHPLFRQADDKTQVRTRATVLINEGRQALIALDHTLANAKLSAALDVLERSFLRFYDPHVIAQVRVLLGVAAVDQARPDLARQHFVEALYLDPALKLDAHYSPQVRTVFTQVAQYLPPAPTPPAASLRRVVRLAQAKLALVLSVEDAGEQVLLKGAMYSDDAGSYTGVESLLVDPRVSTSLAAKARQLGLQMRTMADARFPPPKIVVKPPRNGKPKNGGKPPPRRCRWYKCWYVYAAVGTAITAAIVLPLTLRSSKHVDGTVQWPAP